jgi:hypothetical protein
VSIEAQNPPGEGIAYHDDSPEFATYQEPRHVGMVGRSIATGTQFLELLLGGGIAYIHDQSAAGKGWRLHVIFLRLILFVPWIFLDKEIVNQPFAVQFRIRLEQLGPTYQTRQILSLANLLPKSTDELSTTLLDRLPAMPTGYLQLVEQRAGPAPGNGLPVD